MIGTVAQYQSGAMSRSQDKVLEGTGHPGEISGSMEQRLAECGCHRQSLRFINNPVELMARKHVQRLDDDSAGVF